MRKPLTELFVVLCECVENLIMVNELDYGLENNCSRERTQQTTGKHDCKTGDLRKTTTIDVKLKKPVLKLAPIFYESVFREKSKAGNVGASHQQAKKVTLKHGA